MPVPPTYHLKLVHLALAKLGEKGISNKCPACRSDKLEADAGAFSLTPLNYSKSAVAGELTTAEILFPLVPVANVPMLAVTCKNCGHTQLFNLRALGMVRE